MTAEDPTIRQIVKRGPDQFLTRRQRFDKYLARACAVGLVALGIWLYATNSVAHQANTAARKANTATAQANVSIASQCEFYYGAALASGPTLPAPVSKIGLALLVGARQAYEGLGCDLGPIPAPAPQVKAALPAGVH